MKYPTTILLSMLLGTPLVYGGSNNSSAEKPLKAKYCRAALAPQIKDLSEFAHENRYALLAQDAEAARQSYNYENDNDSDESSQTSWIHRDNKNKDDDFHDKHNSDYSIYIMRMNNNNNVYDDYFNGGGVPLFDQALGTPGFKESLAAIIKTKMRDFRYLQTPTTYDNEPSLADDYTLAKQDGANRYQRDLKYKARDRQKNNPYSRDIRDEDDSVKHQSRLAKILGSGSLHNAEKADHKNERAIHGQKAHARYQNDLPQLAITHPQLTTNNTTQISHVNHITQLPLLHLPITVMYAVLTAHVAHAGNVASNTVRIAPIWSPEKASLKKRIVCPTMLFPSIAYAGKN